MYLGHVSLCFSPSSLPRPPPHRPSVALYFFLLSFMEDFFLDKTRQSFTLSFIFFFSPSASLHPFKLILYLYPLCFQRCIINFYKTSATSLAGQENPAEFKTRRLFRCALNAFRLPVFFLFFFFFLPWERSHAWGKLPFDRRVPARHGGSALRTVLFCLKVTVPWADHIKRITVTSVVFLKFWNV